MDTCIYTRGKGSNRIILGIRVDDQAIVISPNKRVITEFKKEMGQYFKMKDLGPITHIIGVEVKRDRRN